MVFKQTRSSLYHHKGRQDSLNETSHLLGESEVCKTGLKDHPKNKPLTYVSSDANLAQLHSSPDSQRTSDYVGSDTNQAKLPSSPNSAPLTMLVQLLT